MEDVCKKTGVSDQQLDQEISESDIILLSGAAGQKIMPPVQTTHGQYPLEVCCLVS